MAADGARPVEILFSAMTVFGLMDIVPEFPPDMPEIETMFRECQPYLKAARIAQKTADRCKVANDIFEILRPVIDQSNDAG